MVGRLPQDVRAAAAPWGTTAEPPYDHSEVLGGSCKASRVCQEHNLKVRWMVDLVTHGNLAWRDHQQELLRQLRTEPARVIWLDPPGTSTATGSANGRQLGRCVAEMAKTQLYLGISVAIDATTGGHFWKMPEIAALLEHRKLIHHWYSWCGLGARDPVTNRLWQRIRRVLSNLDLQHLCAGWQADVFRPKCCYDCRNQPTMRCFKRNEELDRNKASRVYPLPVAQPIVQDIVDVCETLCDAEVKHNNIKAETRDTS